MNKFVLTTGLTNIATLIATLHKLDPTQKWTVSWRLWKSQRTLDQNARYWKLVTLAGEFCGYTKNEMHQEMGKMFLSYEKIMPDGEIKQFIKSTRDLNTKDMAEYQEHIERVASQQGFVFEEG